MKRTTALLFESHFQRRVLESFLLDGEPVWSAGLVGDALGYAHLGTRLCTLIRSDWSDDFIEGEHIHYLTGERLAAFKRAVIPCHTLSELASRLLLLTTEGVERVLMKSDKPTRIAFRKWFEAEVAFVARERDGAREPDVHPAPSSAAAPSPAAPDPTSPGSAPAPDFAGIVFLHAGAPPAAPATRDERLAGQLDLDNRKFRATMLRDAVRVLHALDQVDDTVRAVYEVRAAEIALDEDLADLRPEPGEQWYTSADVARATGMTPAVVGRVISQLGIRGAAGLSRQVITTTPDDDKTVLSYVYNERAVALILTACGGTTPPGRAA